MFSNRTFNIAFSISCVAHVAVVAQNPGYLFFTPSRINKRIEINYIKPVKIEKSTVKEIAPLRNQPLLRLPAKPLTEKRAPPPFIDKYEIGKGNPQVLSRSLPFERPGLTKPDSFAIKKKITLPAVGLGKINSPSYLSYYQIVREKIRRSAYQSYNRNETGEAYVTFIISDDGYLNDVRVVDDKSSPSNYLRSVAYASVRSASPFPRFPKELNYPQLSFNVVISFEVE